MRNIIQPSASKSITKLLNSIYLGLSNILTSQELLLLESIVRHCGSMKAYKTIPTELFYEGSEYRGVPDIDQIFSYSPRAVHPLAYGRPMGVRVFRKARKVLIDKGYISYRIDRSSLTGKTYSNYRVNTSKILKDSKKRMTYLEVSNVFRSSTICAGSRSISYMADKRADLKRYDLLIRSHHLYVGVSYVLVATHSILRALCAYVGSSVISKFGAILCKITQGIRSSRSVYDSVSAILRYGMCAKVQGGLHIQTTWGLTTITDVDILDINRRYYANQH